MRSGLRVEDLGFKVSGLGREGAREGTRSVRGLGFRV